MEVPHRVSGSKRPSRWRRSGATLYALHVVEEFILAQGLEAPVYVEGLREALRDTAGLLLPECLIRTPSPTG